MANNTYFGQSGNIAGLSSDQGLDIDLSDQNTIELAFQHQIGQQLLSPSINQPHDTFFPCSSLPTPRSSVSHQAEAQPHANAHHTLHSPNGYSQLPVNNVMSRSASKNSSTSSGQNSRFHGLQRASRASFGSNLVSTGSEMSRSISSTSASQRTAPQPYPFQSHSQTGHFRIRRSSDLSPNMGYDQFPTNALNSFDYGINGTVDEGMPGHEGENRGFGQLGYRDEDSSHLSTLPPSSRTPQGSFGEHAPYPNLARRNSPYHVAPGSFSQQSSRSPTQSSPMSPQHSHQRRRHTSSSISTRTDPIIGQVTLSGKFKCLKEACLDDGESISFNRHADFKRHYENMHAGRSIEYFCLEYGCPRSRNPGGGKKGRGFKGRKDKRNEHHKAVHHKEGKKRKRSHDVDKYAEEHDNNDESEAKHVKGRRGSGAL